MERTATRPTVEIRNDMANTTFSRLPQRPKFPSRGNSGASSPRTSGTDISSSASGYTTSTTGSYAPQTPNQAPLPGSTRSLAERFSRVPRAEQQLQLPPQPQHLQSLQQLQQSQQHQGGPPLVSSPIDNNFYNFDTDTESGSASSELSVNTQATSVASDITSSSKETRAPTQQLKHVRHVPSMSKVRMPPRRTTAPPSTTTAASRPSPPKALPSTTTTASRPPQKRGQTSKDLQLSGRRLGSPNRGNNDKELLHKIEQLEREAQDLQASNSRLNRQLADTTEQLSTHGYDHREAERSIKQERMARELVARDLQEQRQRFDEVRSNFELQRTLLANAESERDAMLRAGAETRMELGRLTQDLEQRSQLQRDQEDLLLRQIAAFEKAAEALEKRIASQDQEVKDLTSERNILRSDVRKYEAEAEAFINEKVALAEEKESFAEAQAATLEEREAMKAENEKLQVRIKEVEGQNIDLQNEIENLEQKIGTLQTQIDAFGPEKEELTKRLTDEKEAVEKRLTDEKEALEKELEKEMDLLERELTQEMGDLAKRLESEKQAIEEKLLAEKEAMEKQLTDEKRDVQIHLECEKADLRKQLEDEKATIQAQLEEEKATVQTTLEGEKAAIQKQLDEEKADLLAQIETLETNISGSKMANIALADEKLLLDKKLTEAREHFNEATENLDKLRTEITAFQANIQTLEADKEQAAKDLEAAREEHTKGLETAKEQHTKELEAAKEVHTKELEAAQAKQTELEEKAKTLEADINGLDPDHLVIKNKELNEEKAGLETRISALQAELDTKVPVLEAEAVKVPGLAEQAAKVPGLEEQNNHLASQTAGLMQELNEARTIHAIVAMKAHELELRLKAESKPRRSNGSSSRSSSRSSSKDGSHNDKKSSSGSSSSGSSSSSKKHARSSSSGMVFVRNTGDRAGTVCIMRREEL
ncbi:hypothetical protein PG996_008384 [Apiospora saccharicola]|uniref:Uncharacterized protein n=1 Tax=Apiospora saccharicola TaxID=335842 RepID=A0ABR1UXR7_9PEZI